MQGSFWCPSSLCVAPVRLLGSRCRRGCYCHHVHTIILALPASQTAQPCGVAEQVLVADPNAVALLEKLTTGKWSDESSMLPLRNFGQDLDDLAREMEWHCKPLTAYGLRRGGASCHFTTFGTLDATTYMDRWALSRQARQYVSQALVGSERLNLSNKAQLQVTRLRSVLNWLCQTLGPQHWVATKPSSSSSWLKLLRIVSRTTILKPVHSRNCASGVKETARDVEELEGFGR